ncbi:MAG: hypothetical protein GWO00_20600, partial [Gemmatimonadetes bacterium]|nr:hypothetical protein [Gemmatimonadota bacterium]NIR80665.1 hypothetical protein [Gemmatimonadota bacterium]NIU33259.1 hypothetical protein [Gemmatimonadota bacterium]NIV63594.1 hypothetical protein [Gemmatimonadota bacterium]NIW66311.1 hypothetical protein [Gemmatimonadota bacterium]
MTSGEPEGPSRGAITGWVVLGVSASAALFHMYAAGIQPFTALVQRPVHLALMATLGFLGVGVQATIRAPEDERPRRWARRLSTFAGWSLAGLSVLVCAYLASENQELVARSGSPTPVDLVMGAIAILLVIELARRATGWGLIAVCVLALGYA